MRKAGCGKVGDADGVAAADGETVGSAVRVSSGLGDDGGTVADGLDPSDWLEPPPEQPLATSIRTRESLAWMRMSPTLQAVDYGKTADAPAHR
jgi:hypothetical protein